MRKFDIITEADARVLRRGETVLLARRGHITPLAQDTLNDRRVTVVAEDAVSADEASLVPAADIRTLAIASDHTGIALRRGLGALPRRPGPAGSPFGARNQGAVGYPDPAGFGRL